MRAGANAWLIERSDRKILVDTGSGLHLKSFYPSTGSLPDALADVPIDPASITDIVITYVPITSVA
ncbi:MAG: MBL fold metallo-hydrolase [Pseudomonadota bacterium]